jgi:hypothetical protein
MEQNRFDVTPHALIPLPSRRAVLRGLAAAGLGWGVGRLPESAAAKTKRKKKRRKGKDQTPAAPRCANDGAPCSNPGIACQERFCLQAPFAIEAIWAADDSDHDTYIFLPPEGGPTGPTPYIHFECNEGNSTCAVEFPFACVNRDAQGPGNEVATIYERPPGATHQYWILLDTAPAGELTIVLTDRVGRVVRAWTNPANAGSNRVAWHVFDIDGDGRVTSIDTLPGGLPNSAAGVCPYLDQD